MTDASTQPASADAAGLGRQIYVQAVGLGLDPAWRRLPDDVRAADAAAVLAAEDESTTAGFRALVYSSIVGPPTGVPATRR